MAQELLEPGIYFGLSFRDYLADPALSNSGIQNLRISPLTYWVNSPLNPDYEPEETKATETGKAFHSRILEGKEAFAAAYAPKLSKDDFPDALKSGDELKAKCAELMLPKSGTLAELSARIRAIDPHVQLWSEIEAAHLELHAGKEFLSKGTLAQIELAASAIEANPATAELFSGGFPEVSIIWVDEATGVRMKARLDYLTLSCISDLKTFSNSLGKPLGLAVAHAMATYGYGLQAITYLDAVRNAKRMLAADPKAARFCGGWLGVPFDFDAWLAKFKAAPEPRFVFAFQETGGVPNVALRQMNRNTHYFDLMTDQYRFQIERYRECVERWGFGRPWVDPAEVELLEDQDFPLWVFTN